MKTEFNNSNVQFDYFSSNYIKFEEDYYRYSKINIPLTFLTSDILRLMISTDKEYFMLNKTNSKDKKDHYFIFKKKTNKDNENIFQFEYLEHRYILKN